MNLSPIWPALKGLTESPQEPRMGLIAAGAGFAAGMGIGQASARGNAERRILSGSISTAAVRERREEERRGEGYGEGIPD